MELFGPPDVTRLEARRDVDGLIRALAYKKDDAIRRAAAEALGRLGDARAVEPLITALRAHWRASALAAAEALGRIGDLRAIGPLIGTLHSAHPEDMLRIAVDALVAFGQPAVEPLARRLRSEIAEEAWLAAGALARIGCPGVEALIAALRDQSPYARRAASEALGQAHDRRAVGPLIDVLREHDSASASAARALGALGDARAVEPLAAELSNEHLWWEARKEAAIALGRIGDARAVEPLAAALRDRDDKIRSAAAEALTQLAVPDDLATDAWYLVAERNWEAAFALGSIAVEPLVLVALTDKDKNAADAARTLGKIGDARAVEALVDVLAANRMGTVPAVTAEALGAIGDARAVGPLVARLKESRYSHERKAVAAALARLYRSGTLTASDQQLILDQQPLMAVPHFDQYACGHDDSGIGIEI
jgi:HEAT repeat protein